eukprot:GHVU01081103.1.p1 GENE.GHVU01081103.1~~GHVU01081103.1.p1  ORF type:complete len:112 (+),score=5.64 GHVU01081103.1:172-507(+)
MNDERRAHVRSTHAALVSLSRPSQSVQRRRPGSVAHLTLLWAVLYVYMYCGHPYSTDTPTVAGQLASPSEGLLLQKRLHDDDDDPARLPAFHIISLVYIQFNCSLCLQLSN